MYISTQFKTDSFSFTTWNFFGTQVLIPGGFELDNTHGSALFFPLALYGSQIIPPQKNMNLWKNLTMICTLPKLGMCYSIDELMNYVCIYF